MLFLPYLCQFLVDLNKFKVDFRVLDIKESIEHG